MPKVTLPKNDDSDKFWGSVEPYCANVAKEDLRVCILGNNYHISDAFIII